MIVLDDAMVGLFRSSLPEVHNRETWINETILEYHRLCVLQEQGVELNPVEDSLMWILLKLEDRSVISISQPDAKEAYIANFGHEPTYCWTVKLSDLRVRMSTGSSAPGVGWMSNNV